MKNCLFAALLLGSLIPLISSQSESFDFIDSQGRCWRCVDGSCASCPAALLPQIVVPLNFPDPWDLTCPGPSAQDCIDFPIGKFPADDINWYWDCAHQSGNVPLRCECDKGFDMRQQMCVFSNNMQSIGCNEQSYSNKIITDCASTPTTVATTTTVTTTTSTPCVCMPFWPCRCNPCWNMPCHSCGGCGMMMG
ncbi:hypothetical protein ACKWTF_015724 [Chironomus riparius]